MLMDRAAATTTAARCRLCVTYDGGDRAFRDQVLPLVDAIEVTPDNFARAGAEAVTLDPSVVAELRACSAVVQVLVHGVGLSIGSHDGYSETYLRVLGRLFHDLSPRWHSEHLGYTSVDGEHLGTMLAVPKTTAVLEMLCRRINAIQQRFGLPFLVENIVHVLPDYPGDYSEAAFLNAIAARTGCGLLLDLYNLECDAHNHGFDIPAFLAELDLGAVRELHLASGVEHRGYLVDVHSRRLRDSTLALADEVLTMAGGTIEVVTYELLPEAVPILGHATIADELRGLRSRLL
jgi:uncharacterized protein (UPF0276 family)